MKRTLNIGYQRKWQKLRFWKPADGMPTPTAVSLIDVCTDKTLTDQTDIDKAFGKV